MTNAHDFTLRLQDLLARERVAMADFLIAVSEFDRRTLWRDLGYASLFDYLHRELGLSKASTFLRASAARLIQKYPEVIEPLRDGRLCLSTMGELSKTLTTENRDEVLPRFFHLSKREAKVVAAELRPDEAAPRREVITTIRMPESPRRGSSASSGGSSPGEGPRLSLGVVRPDEPEPAAPATPAIRPAPAFSPPSAVEPLTAELSRIHVTLPRRVLDKADAARAALSHSHPGAGLAEIIEAGIDLLLERHAKRNGLVKKPRNEPRPSTNPNYIPAHVRRAVQERDGGRCQNPVASGGVCGSTLRTELHHINSRSRGGPPTVENLTTLCGFHHDRETRREFGDELVEEIVRGKRGRPQPTA